MEYTPLGLEHFSPAYIDYFYSLPPTTKARVVSKQDLLHKGMSANTIRAVYHQLYERSIANQQTYSSLMSNCELLNATLGSTRNDRLSLTLRQHEQDHKSTAEYDCVIAGTGYKDELPQCLNRLFSAIEYDEFGQPKINRDYTLVYQNHLANHNNNSKIFVQNKETHTHGVGAGDLGLGAYRAGCIVNELMGKPIYDTETLDIFQKFGK